MSDPKATTTTTTKKVIPKPTDEEPKKDPKTTDAKKKEDTDERKKDETTKTDSKKKDTDERKKDETTKATTKKTKESGKPKRASLSKSKRAQLQFPVGKIRTQIKKTVAETPRIGETAPVFLAAVLEYLAAETLELAGNAARQAEKKRIIPKHILFAVRNDTELNLLFNADMADTGVNPIETRKIIMDDKARKLRKVKRREDLRQQRAINKTKNAKKQESTKKTTTKKTTTKKVTELDENNNVLTPMI